jgi:predicted RNA binding protein YcfA (HicA-like mRNA interferase family)
MSSELYRRLTAVLKEGGCYFLRQGKGSHEIWFSPVTSRAFSIPANIKPLPLAKAILKAAGLNESID